MTHPDKCGHEAELEALGFSFPHPWLRGKMVCKVCGAEVDENYAKIHHDWHVNNANEGL